MTIEAALIKPVVDALLSLFKQGENIQLKRNAEKALREAIRELLLANPDENKAKVRIAIAKAAGIISEDIVLAEDMLEKHRVNKARTRGKGGTGRKRKSTMKCAAKRQASDASANDAANIAADDCVADATESSDTDATKPRRERD